MTKAPTGTRKKTIDRMSVNLGNAQFPYVVPTLYHSPPTLANWYCQGGCPHQAPPVPGEAVVRPH